MPRSIPRLTPADLDALRGLAAGQGDVAPVSRYWLSVYELIDETPAGWRITERGHDLLRQPVIATRVEAISPADPRILTAAAAVAERRVIRRRRRRPTMTA